MTLDGVVAFNILSDESLHGAFSDGGTGGGSSDETRAVCTSSTGTDVKSPWLFCEFASN